MAPSDKARSKDFRGVRLFSLIAFLYSWPIFFTLDAWLIPKYFDQGNVAAGWLVALFGHMLAMAGPGIAAILILKKYHKESLPRWKWDYPRRYVLIALSMLSLWTLPGIIGIGLLNAFHLRSPIETFAWVLTGASLTVGWAAGMGEEMGWSAYLLPRLAPHIGRSRALVAAGAIRGLWHWPLLVSMHINKAISGSESITVLIIMSVVLALQLIVSNALFGSLAGWIWYKTESLPLVGWFHQWFDATRDTTALLAIGYSGSLWFTVLWGMPFYLVAGLLLMRVAGEEKANLWTLAPPRGTE